MAIVYLALGSNLGDRFSYLKKAVALLEEGGVQVQRHSSIIETEPVGGPLQGKYLNAVVKSQTELSPEDLHQLTQHVECKLGRIKKEHNGPRVIDIDILLYDDIKLITPKLIIPHARMCERNFVMKPLKEIAPNIYQEFIDARG